MPSPLKELQDLMHNRAKIYSFLSNIYAIEAGKAFLNQLKNDGSIVVFKDTEMSISCERLIHFLASININDKCLGT